MKKKNFQKINDKLIPKKPKKEFIIINPKQTEILKSLDATRMSMSITKMSEKTKIPIATIYDQWMKFLSKNKVKLFMVINDDKILDLGLMKK